MKGSIKRKLFIGVTCLVVFFVSFSMILNSCFFKTYYISQKKSMLIKNSKYIDSIYKNNFQEISFEFEKIERNNAIHMTIVDSNNNIKYDSMFKRSYDFSDIKRPSGRFNIIKQFDNKELNNEQYIFKIAKDRRLNTDFLNLYHLLNNGDKLLLSIPLQEVTANVNISNKFLMLTGVLTIIIGIMATLIYSKKFTQPILNLNKITQSMSKLDFRWKYVVTSQDEIGELGENINSLSEQLDKSINELKEKNKELRADIEKERALDDMRKGFIANVSHELKTPISLIQGYAEGLRINVVEDEENKKFYCDVIVNEAKKMNQLVKSLLNLSLIDLGSPELEISLFNMSELIEELINKFLPIFNEKQVKLDRSKVKELMVSGDRLMIGQILVNYINNAINHINEKREIIIETSRNASKVRVTIFNSGKQIPKEDIDKVWQSFYKVDKARTRAYGGTGLGLSIVAGIQRLHGNTYGLRNVEGGVEFWFDIDT
ncbi:sensor histidine kinase [Clostridium sp. FP1]|uniref:sensor histidine kinase n=1 Tax=Clostridium sp. FP1 TaxID=2724076 RepID=UPI0013E91D9B|nr:HAMP domain-containing sensor histidine kinase [Clostridium sp. FP1]MBZ9634798.1 HAMP domain-containing histidine kinase [Clostridium sp. FP1]